MGVGEALEQSKLLDRDAAKAVQTAESIVGGIASAISYVGMAESVLQKLGIFEKEDELAKKLGEISEKLDKLYLAIDRLKDALAHDVAYIVKHDTMLHVSDINGDVNKAIVNLHYHLLNPTDPNYPEAPMLDNTLDGTITLIQSTYWEGFYAEELVFNNLWTGRLAPPDISDISTWDYRRALPSYLHAISSRIIVLQALYPNFRSDKEGYCKEIREYAEYLLIVHNKIIEEGIVGIRLPNDFELVMSYVSNFVNYATAFPTDPDAPNNVTYHARECWKGHKCIYGLVERYSGQNNAQNFQLPALELSSIPELKNNSPFTSKYKTENWELKGGNCVFKEGDLDYIVAWKLMQLTSNGTNIPAVHEYYTNVFLPKYFVRLAKLWLDFYYELGLCSVWRTINYLYRLAGSAPLEVPNCNCLTNLIPSMGSSLFMRLSLRNIYNLMVRSLEFGGSDYIKDHSFSSPGHPISMLEIAQKLRVNSPITLRRLYED